MAPQVCQHGVEVRRRSHRGHRGANAHGPRCLQHRFPVPVHARVVGLGQPRQPRQARPGTASRNSCVILPATSNELVVVPVTLPPGRASLATNPVSTGADAYIMTIGITDVARFNAATSGFVRRSSTSGAEATSSAARAGRAAASPFAERCSTTRFFPSWYPRACNQRSTGSGVLTLTSERQPRRQTLDPAGCARSVSSRPVAVPAARSMSTDLRLFIRASRGSD